MKLVPIEYRLQRFHIDRAYCPFFELGGCRGFQFVGHPLRQLLKTRFKAPPQKPRLTSFQADREAPFEFAAEYLVVEQTLRNWQR